MLTKMKKIAKKGDFAFIRSWKKYRKFEEVSFQSINFIFSMYASQQEMK